MDFGMGNHYVQVMREWTRILGLDNPVLTLYIVVHDPTPCDLGTNCI